jgi:glycosyltransferase involved in cell wall biosynthesis
MIPIIPSGKRDSFQKETELMEELRRRGIHVIPIFLSTSDFRFRNFLNPATLFRDSKSIFKALRALDPDAVVGFYALHAVPLAIFKKLFKYVLSVVATGGDVNLHIRQPYSTVRKFIYSQSDLVFAVSTDLQEKMRREWGQQPILLHTGIDPSFFRNLDSKDRLRPKWKLGKDDVVVLTVCNLVKHKGVHVLIEALGDLQRRMPSSRIRLLVVGEGPEERNLKKQSSDLGVSENTIFLGSRTRKELLELYNIADLFVLASYSEGLPFVLLEAMACETTCVSTPVGDIGKVIRTGYNGFLVKAGDSTNLADRMEEALSLQAEKKLAISVRARETVERDFDLRRIMLVMVQTLWARVKEKGRVPTRA